MRSSQTLLPLMAFMVLSSASCGGDEKSDDGANSGGANSGGANSGGANSGGANSGGANSGGANSGGANSGTSLEQYTPDQANWSTFASKPREAGLVACLLYTSPSPRDRTRSRMPSSA